MKNPIIQRYELKFKCEQSELSKFYDWIHSSDAFFKESYDNRIVNSIYYDTINNTSLTECRNDSVNKKKVRLRWYNNDLVKSRLEIKYKRGIVNYKKIYPYLKNESKSIRDLVANCHIEFRDDELTAAFVSNPRVLVSYNREYFESDNPLYNGLRVTVDSSVRYQHFDPFGDMGIAVPDRDNLILEIKFPISLYDLAIVLIRNLDSELSRNSKYANAYEYV